MKRYKDEFFEDFKARRKANNKFTKLYLQGKRVVLTDREFKELSREFIKQNGMMA